MRKKFNPTPPPPTDTFQVHLAIQGPLGVDLNRICKDKKILRGTFVRQCIEYALENMDK